MDRIRGLEPHRLARALLALGSLSGIGIYLTTPFASPEQVMLASDVYRHAAARLLAGQEIYGTAPPGYPGYFYLYPPIVTVLFLPHALLGSGAAAYALQTALNLFAVIGIAVFLIRLLRRRGVAVTRLDLGLLVGFFVLSSYSAIQFINGQVNLWLAFAFAVGFDALDRRHEGLVGGAFGAAALLKVFPAVMGLWLLRLRAWRAVGAALATGVGGLLLGAAVLGPELTATYVTDVLIDRFTGSTYDGRPAADAGVDGIHRQLAAIWPGGERWHTPVGIVLLGGLLAAASRRVRTRRQRDVAGLATITTVLLFLPVQPLYFPLLAVPLVLVLYDLPVDRSGAIFVAGTLLTLFHLDMESLALLLSVVRMPEGIATVLLDASAVVFRVVLPPTLGMWLLLVGCVAFQWYPAEAERPDSKERPSTDPVTAEE